MHPDGPTCREADRALRRAYDLAGSVAVNGLRAREPLADPDLRHTCELAAADIFWRPAADTCQLCAVVARLCKLEEALRKFNIATLAWEPCLESDCRGCHFCWWGTPTGWVKTRLAWLHGRWRRWRIRRRYR